MDPALEWNEPRAGRHEPGEVGFPAVRRRNGDRPIVARKRLAKSRLSSIRRVALTSLIQQGTTRLHPTRARREIVGSSVSRVFTLENYKF